MTNDQKTEYRAILDMANALHDRIVSLQQAVPQEELAYDNLEGANSAMAEVNYQLDVLRAL